MKKAYINPDTSIILVTAQSMIAASVEGFKSTLDETVTIENEDQMLSRRKNNVWEEEEEEDEMAW
jgi:hypothetical protein